MPLIALDIVRHIAALEWRAGHVDLPTVSHMLGSNSAHGGEPRLPYVG